MTLDEYAIHALQEAAKARPDLTQTEVIVLAFDGFLAREIERHRSDIMAAEADRRRLRESYPWLGDVAPPTHAWIDVPAIAAPQTGHDHG